MEGTWLLKELCIKQKFVVLETRGWMSLAGLIQRYRPISTIHGGKLSVTLIRVFDNSPFDHDNYAVLTGEDTIVFDVDLVDDVGEAITSCKSWSLTSRLVIRCDDQLLREVLDRVKSSRCWRVSIERRV
jgi:hypothetical protein